MRKSDRLPAILGLSDDLDVPARLEDQSEAAPDKGLVIDDQNADAHWVSERGIRAITR